MPSRRWSKRHGDQGSRIGRRRVECPCNTAGSLAEHSGGPLTARRSNVALVLALAAACFAPSMAAWQAYDEPPRFTATRAVGTRRDQRSSLHHRSAGSNRAVLSRVHDRLDLRAVRSARSIGARRPHPRDQSPGVARGRFEDRGVSFCSRSVGGECRQGRRRRGQGSRSYGQGHRLRYQALRRKPGAARGACNRVE